MLIGLHLAYRGEILWAQEIRFGEKHLAMPFDSPSACDFSISSPVLP